MTILSMLLMITLGRPEMPTVITPNQLVVNTPRSRSLWAAPARSVWPPLGTTAISQTAKVLRKNRWCKLGYANGTD
jgi:hypothetical protein